MGAGEDHEKHEIHERLKEISRGGRKRREEVRERFRLKTVRLLGGAFWFLFVPFVAVPHLSTPLRPWRPLRETLSLPSLTS
jgi:hypothetical protein